MIRTTADHTAARVHAANERRPTPGEPHERRAEQRPKHPLRRPGAHAPAAAARGRRRRRAARRRGLLAPRAVERREPPRAVARCASGSAAAARPTTSTPRSINGPSATTRGQVFYETLVWLDGTFKLHDWLCDECEPNTAGERLDGAPQAGPRVPQRQDGDRGRRPLLDPPPARSQVGRDRGRPARRDRPRRAARRSTTRTVQFVLKRPTSFFDQVLSDIVYIVPVGYNPKKPVSTGPWKFVSYKPGQQTVLEPFANYWGAKPTVDRLVIVELPGRLRARQRAALRPGRRDQPGAVRAGARAARPTATCRRSSRRRRPGTRSRCASTRRRSTTCACARRSGSCMDRKQAVQTALFGQGVPASDYYGRFDPSAGTSLKREAGHRPGEVAAQGGRQAEPQGRARDLADLGGHRRGLPGAGPERQGGRHRHLAQQGRRLDLLRRLRQVAVRGRLLGRSPVPRHRVAQRRPGRERRQHDALQRPRVQQALQPGRADARRRQARARSSSACRRSSTSAAAT